jgi:hypothetical protein
MHTETTASIAGLAAVIVATLLTTTESSLLSTSIASFIHRAVAGNVANFAAYELDKRCCGIYICSNQSRHCAFHHLVEDRRHPLVEDIPWRDVQFHRSGSKPCSLGVLGNLGKDDRLLLLTLA